MHIEKIYVLEHTNPKESEIRAEFGAALNALIICDGNVCAISPAAFEASALLRGHSRIAETSIGVIRAEIKSLMQSIEFDEEVNGFYAILETSLTSLLRVEQALADLSAAVPDIQPLKP